MSDGLRRLCAGVKKIASFFQKLKITAMEWFNQDKEKQRFYLLPGQGGRGLRKKRKFMLQCSVAVGLLVALAVAAVICWLNNCDR